MDTKVLIQSFTEFAKQKNVDRPTMIRILQDVFRAMIKKKYEHDENFDIVINADKGDLEIMRFREIVDDNSEDIWDFDKIKFLDMPALSMDVVLPGASEKARQLADDLLRLNPTSRPTAATAQTHAYFTEAVEKTEVLRSSSGVAIDRKDGAGKRRKIQGPEKLRVVL